VFAASAGGVLAYQPSQRVDKFEIATIDRQGTMVSTVGPPSLQGWVTVSPDGKRAVVRDTLYDVPGDLWNVDVATGARTRLTFNHNDYSPGVWSPDGTRVAYAGGDLGDTLYEKRAVGNGSERELFKEPGTRHFVTSWSRDGRFLLYHTENTPKTGYDVWALPLEGERKPVRLPRRAVQRMGGPVFARHALDRVCVARDRRGERRSFCSPIHRVALGRTAVRRRQVAGINHRRKLADLAYSERDPLQRERYAD
jgi:dipeptidyl aminopeptidase/acylaminoacyl peptidase